MRERTLLVLLVLATPCLAQLDARTLVEHLRDDAQDWNASRAMDALGELPTPPIEELQAALDSEDWQQRQLAATLLWRFYYQNRYFGSEYPAWRFESQGSP